MCDAFKPKRVMDKSHWLVFLLTVVLLPVAEANNALQQPLAIGNLNPFIRIYGIPNVGHTGVQPRGYNFDLALDIGSSFTDAESDRESIAMDGESYQVTLRGVYGWGNGWESGIEFPLIKHSGGFLDSFILHWHDAFGLPQLGRDNVANNQLRYAYRRDGVDRVNLRDSESGLGDIVLFAGRALPFADHTAARVHLKLPTGRASGLFGSGGSDIAASLQSAKSISENWRVYGGAGGAHLGSGEILPELQRHWVAFANLGIIWQPATWLALQLQLAGQTSVYKDSALHQLNSAAAQTTVGGTLKLARNWYLDLAVTEDEVIYDVSPDVSFHLRLRHTTH